HGEPELLLERQDGVDQRRVAPFMDQDHIRSAQLAEQEIAQRVVEVVEADVKLGKQLAEVVDRVDSPLAFVANEVGERPRTQLFVATHVAAGADEAARESAEEVCVAV